MNTALLEVLAKSEPPIPLKQHIDECLRVHQSLRKAFGRLPLNDVYHFWELIRLSIIIHDLGKAHSEFQKLLYGKRSNWYHQRHELFSIVFVDLLDMSEEDKNFLKLIVAGHHKDFNFLIDHIQHSYKTENDLFSFSEDGKLQWEEEIEKLNIAFIKSFLTDFGVLLNSDSSKEPFNEIKKYLRAPYNTSNLNFQILLLAAGALKQCDHLASAGIFKVNILEEKHFSFLYNTKWNAFYHQKKASETIGNIILTAPTGSGKTEASLMWLHKQINATGQGRAFYILPFTASINAMFERLDEKMDGNNEIVGVLHGKLSEYIESHFGDENNSTKNETLKRELKDNFRALVTPLKVATPFQLLKSIFGLKGFEKGMFEMSGSYFIFDEIHAYDPEVTAQIKVLIEFAIKYLNVNVCLMTATLPAFLKKEFSQAIGNYTEINANEKLYKSFIRHRVKIVEGLLSDHISDIQQRLNSGDKVLVVCNSVAQSQKVFDQLIAKNKVLLHGKFNGMDRNKKESELKGKEVNLLVGTQAIEVSLDIDYDVLFTEPAPLDALLQRFGRINRHRLNDQYRLPCDCIVYTERHEADKYIYKDDEIIDRTLSVLLEIESQNSGIIQEINLQKYIDQVYPDWSVKGKEDFDRIYTHLTLDVEENLAPFIYYQHREEEFENQFDGIKVLPSIFQDEYINLVEAHKFIIAESLKVKVSNRQFAQLINSNSISKTISAFDSKKAEQLMYKTYFVIDKEYTSELGLRLDKEYKSESNFL